MRGYDSIAAWAFVLGMMAGTLFTSVRHIYEDAGSNTSVLTFGQILCSVLLVALVGFAAGSVDEGDDE